MMTRNRAGTVAVLAALLVAGAPAVARAQQPAVPAPAADAAQAAWEAGDHARARELYAARVAADSGDVQALHRLGLLLAWDRQFASAIPLLERLVGVAPSRAARLDLARALSWAGRFGAAEAAYRRMLADDAADAAALRGVAQVASWRGDLAGGEAGWRAVLAVDASDADAHMGLSQVLRWSGRPAPALEHAREAARLRPGDREVLDQLAWAEASFATRIAPTIAGEQDSDHNRLLTAGVTVVSYPHPRVALTLNGYVRTAEGPTPAGLADVTGGSRAASGSLRLELGSGWGVSAGAGVVSLPDAVRDAEPTWRAGVSSPAWRPLSVSAGYAHSVLDATADLMRRGVRTGDATLTVSARLVPWARLEGGAAVTRFRGVETNERVLGRVALDARAGRALRLRPRATAFRFDRSTREGYFAPDEYVLAELGIGWDRWMDRWSVTAEVAPGAQRIGSDGDVQGAISGRVRIGYTMAPGRELGIGLSLSNLGVERLQAGSAGYRHQSLVLSAAWGF